MDDKDYAEFVNKYGEEVVLAGYEDFTKYANKRNKALDELSKERTKNDINFSEHNKLFNANKRWPYEEHLQKLTSDLKAEELEIAKKHGHKEVEKLPQELDTEEKKIEFKENSDDLANDDKQASAKLKEKTDENKLDEKSVAEQFKEQKEDLDAERAKFIAEMMAAKERNRDKERDR